MSGVFALCSKMENLNLSNFITSKVKDMKFMFWECGALQSLDLSNFNTSRVMDMLSMFSGCDLLEYVIMYGCDTRMIDSITNALEEANINAKILM